MGLVATQSGTDFEPAPCGTHVARCVRLIDLGTQHSTYYDKWSHKVLITWELPGELQEADNEGKERPFLVQKRYTCSLAEQASLYKDLNSWRGKPFTTEDLKGFKLENVVGKPCMVTVVHSENGGKTYADVASVTGLPKGMDCPGQISDTVIYDVGEHDQEVFEGLGEKLKATINNSKERAGSTPDSEAKELAGEDPPF